jgi:hypothetical protein
MFIEPLTPEEPFRASGAKYLVRVTAHRAPTERRTFISGRPSYKHLGTLWPGFVTRVSEPEH